MKRTRNPPTQTELLKIHTRLERQFKTVERCHTILAQNYRYHSTLLMHLRCASRRIRQAMQTINEHINEFVESRDL